MKCRQCQHANDEPNPAAPLRSAQPHMLEGRCRHTEGAVQRHTEGAVQAHRGGGADT